MVCHISHNFISRDIVHDGAKRFCFFSGVISRDKTMLLLFQEVVLQISRVVRT
jgi:hypothetical protein